MSMLEWHTANAEFSLLSHGSQAMGSDASSVNIFLLADTYRTQVALQDGLLYRFYRGASENRRGYGFPLGAPGSDSARILSVLRRDAAARGVPLTFCLCDERQRKVLDSLCTVRWRSFDGDSDYIYKRESLAQLSGKKLHAKKNLVNRFWRLHPEAVYRPLSAENSADAVTVAERWFEERASQGGGADKKELMHIRIAAERRSEMGIFGGVLYVDGEPAAMTMASASTAQCVDVHFEKAVGTFAADGAFAAVNQAFAASDEVLPYMYINREEDMGLPGLRQVKETYRPAYKLEKFYGVVSD